jgi:hypothetical protein
VDALLSLSRNYMKVTDSDKHTILIGHKITCDIKSQPVLQANDMIALNYYPAPLFTRVKVFVGWTTHGTCAKNVFAVL